MMTDCNINKIVIESLLQFVINSIKGLIKVTSQIINHILNIVILAKSVDDIQFDYNNKF